MPPSKLRPIILLPHNSLALEDAEYDLEDWWNQMDGIADQPPIHDVKVSPGIPRHPDYVLSEINIYSCPPIFNKNNSTGCILNVSMVSLEIMNTTLN